LLEYGSFLVLLFGATCEILRATGMTLNSDRPEVLITLTVNGLKHTLELDPETPLVYVLRNDLSLFGAKLGCGLGQCGACVVLANGEPIYACTARIEDMAGKEIETVEGLVDKHGHLHPIQDAFIELNAAQCGYCTAGIIMRTKALLNDYPHPSRTRICNALDDHLCRCGAQPRVIRAVERAAIKLSDRTP
jgi:nicotinate dehydrogenase subunit A